MLLTKIETGKGAVSALRMIGSRNFAANTQPQRVPPTERPYLPSSAGLKFTRLPNGLFLATVDNRNPVARISLVFKAGTRYETTETRGIVHRVRNLVGLSTNRRTSVDFNYYVASLGAILSSTATRDHLSIDIQVSRNYANAALQLLNELVGEPFGVHQYELDDSTSQMWYEKNQLKDDLAAYSFEKLHKVAYRQHGLANSLLAPKYSIGKHKVAQVEEFAHRYLSTGNATLVATGVDHEEVLKFATNRFILGKGGAASHQGAPKFFAGEARKLRPNSDYAMAHIAAPGPGLSDVRGSIIHAVLAEVMGTGPTTKWSEGGQSRLARAARKAVQTPFHVVASNSSYEDTGIFSLFYTSYWEDSATLAKALVGEMRSVSSGGVSDKDLQAAKNRLKYRLLSGAENDDGTIEDLAIQAAVRQADIHLASDQAKLVDGVSTNDIQQAAKQVVSGKFALSSIGRLDKTPYLDELIA